MGLQKALMTAFPELDFNFYGSCLLDFYVIYFILTLCLANPRSYWKDVAACREFFDRFARDQGMDPLRAETWTTMVDLSKLQERKVTVTYQLLYLVNL